MSEKTTQLKTIKQNGVNKMMNAEFLVTNNAWIVTFGTGHDRQILTLEDKIGQYPRFFQTLEKLDYALKNCGLQRNNRNAISIEVEESNNA